MDSPGRNLVSWKGGLLVFQSTPRKESCFDQNKRSLLPNIYISTCKLTENYMFLCKINVKCRIFKKFRLFNSHEQVWKMSNLKIKCRLGIYCSLFWFTGAVKVFWSLPKSMRLVFNLWRLLSLCRGQGRGGDSGVRAGFWALGQPDGTWETPFEAERMVLVGTKMLQWSLLRQEASRRILGEMRKRKHFLSELCQDF